MTFYSLGLKETITTDIQMTQSQVEELFEKIKQYSLLSADNSQKNKILQLKEEILQIAQVHNLMSTDMRNSFLQENIVDFELGLKQSMILPVPIFQNRASAFLCNFVTMGEGTQFPIIVLPRLVPILLFPIPRVYLGWKATDAFTSCGSYLSGRGYIARGEQTGLALGFWGIGFSVFIPPILSYGFIGYALFTSAKAEMIEPWPPNNPPEILQVDPADGQINVPITLSELSFQISDPDEELMSYSVTTSPDIGSGTGILKPDGTYSVPVSGLQDLTEYSWFVEVDDGFDTTSGQYKFTTEANAPIVSDPDPKDGSRHISIELDSLSFYLKDYQGDPIDYTVETVPNIGSGSGYNVGEGTYSISVSGLDYDTEYLWFVNTTDGQHEANKIFRFKTRLAPATWWDDGWLYRKYVGIMDSLSEYQMKLQIWLEDGYDDVDNGIIDTEGHCKLDFSDIRFVTYDGLECSYWIEEIETVNDDHCATVWVKIFSVDDEQIYLYYGNPNALDESNGEDTFIFFEDCETGDIDDKWDVTNYAGTMSSFSNNRAYQGTYSIYQEDTSYSDPTYIKMKESFQEPNIRIYAKIYQTNDFTGSADYNSIYTYFNEIPILTVYFKGDGDVEYYKGSVYDTGYDFVKEAWNNWVLKMDSTTNYAHIFVNGQDCGDVHRNSFDEITSLFLGTTTGYRCKGNWDNILICKWTSDKEPTWEYFSSEEMKQE